jgi:hypothetical protein
VYQSKVICVRRFDSRFWRYEMMGSWNESVRGTPWWHLLEIVDSVSRIDAGSIETDHRARDGTERGRILGHPIRDSTEFHRMRLFVSFWRG